LAAGLTPLMLGWTDFSLFRHGKMESIFSAPSDVAAKIRNFLKKNPISALTGEFARLVCWPA
jgi:hypothetical protein